MAYQNLRDFIADLNEKKQLATIKDEISPHIEITQISDAVLRAEGPALLFTNPKGYSTSVLTNLFGTVERIALAINNNTDNNAYDTLRQIGHLLAQLREPQAPSGLREFGNLWKIVQSVWKMYPKITQKTPCQTFSQEKNDVNLFNLPIQTCWPQDIAPMITWGLTITKGPLKKRQNLGIYRQQLIDKRHVIMRWLPHRGGAIDFIEFAKLNPGKPFPVAVAIGADPATMLSAVIPIPDTISEYHFAGLLRGRKTRLSPCLTPGLEGLHIPSNAEIILEGFIYPINFTQKQKNFHKNSIPDTITTPPPGKTHKSISQYEHALEGPFGDHTGYYNEQEWFPVLTIERITQREKAIYHSTYTGKPPDEPAILATALNEIFIPLVQKQFPEIIDFYLPPEGCSYRLAIVQIKKCYPGHAKRVMMGIWGFLRQFMYTKIIIVVDEDICARDWKEVTWALTTRVDPRRDMTIIDNTPIDYLDFASPLSGLGSKLGIDATNKFHPETQREWGTPIQKPKIQRSIIEKLIESLTKKT